jgi:glycosyltransferase involved in cell wall biosynthesis
VTNHIGRYDAKRSCFFSLQDVDQKHHFVLELLYNRLTMKQAISVVLAVKDEADMLEGALRQLGFADEIVVQIDSRTADATETIARKYTDRVMIADFKDFASFKNQAMSNARNDWVLLLDADERLSAALIEEILAAVSADEADVFEIPFESYFFGRAMRHGGWQNERHQRLFKRSLVHYQGEIHESLQLAEEARRGSLVSPIIHLSHRSIGHVLAKTSGYVDVQASEMLKDGHPKVTARTLYSVIFKEFWRRMIRQKGYRDGLPGIIESLYQPFSLFCVYVRLWELQQAVPLEKEYQEIEASLHETKH